MLLYMCCSLDHLWYFVQLLCTYYRSLSQENFSGKHKERKQTRRRRERLLRVRRSSLVDLLFPTGLLLLATDLDMDNTLFFTQLYLHLKFH